MVVRKMKEKCKDAARMRREKERAEFVELSKLLPLPASTTSQLDKASIIRLTSSYLRMRSAFPEGLGDNWGRVARQAWRQASIEQQQLQQVRELGSLILQTLDGFVFALHRDGKIMYISETASVHLGLPQIDLTGSSLYDYLHPADQADVRQMLALTDSDRAHLSHLSCGDRKERLELARSFCMRMKCILPKRNAGLVSSGYKAIHCNGYLKVKRVNNLAEQAHSSQYPHGSHSPGTNDWTCSALVAVGHSLLPSASTEVKLTRSSFMFRANLDLKLYYIEAQTIQKLLGFEQTEIIGQSLYQFVHVADLAALESSHRTLLDKGQVVTKYFRLMKRHGGFVWVQSYATLVNNPRNMPKPQHIISICVLIAEDSADSSASLLSAPSSAGQPQSPDPHPPNQQVLPVEPLQPLQAQLHHEHNPYQLQPQFVMATSASIHRKERQVGQATQRKNRKQLKGCNQAQNTVYSNWSSGDMELIYQEQRLLEPSGMNDHHNHYTDNLEMEHQHFHGCACLHEMGSQSTCQRIPPTNGTPMRRSSDDTCSIVSSIAAASVSSASSVSSSSFSLQIQPELIGYNSSMDADYLPVTGNTGHAYLYNSSSPPYGLKDDMGPSCPTLMTEITHTQVNSIGSDNCYQCNFDTSAAGSFGAYDRLQGAHWTQLDKYHVAQ